MKGEEVIGDWRLVIGVRLTAQHVTLLQALSGVA